MPLYLVRWPDFSISLVHAKDEGELSHTLDEVGDPGACRWKVYKGPLHLKFKMNLGFQDETNYAFTPVVPKAKISNINEFCGEGARFELADPHLSDTHSKMWEEFVRFSFPKLYAMGSPSPCYADNLSQEEYFKIATDVESAAKGELAEFFEANKAYKQNNEDLARDIENGNN